MKKFVNKMKNFWRLQKKNNSGFTLVELIVVIAVLAILAGIAVPAYSGYVEKANKQADMTLAGDVKRALELAYYSDPEFEGGVVALSLTEAPDVSGNESLESALEKTFGASWVDLRLKYDGWSAKFKESGFYGDGTGLNDLLTTVDGLTDALSAALASSLADSVAGTGFEEYIENLGVQDDSTSAANAAVFFVADKTSDLGSDDLVQIKNIIGQGLPADKALERMDEITGSSLSSAAALYALAEGYARYYDKINPSKIGEEGTPSVILDEYTGVITEMAENGEVSNALAAYTVLVRAFDEMNAVDGNCAYNYYQNNLISDLEAYKETMKTVSASKNVVLDNAELSNDNFFTDSSIQNLLSQYAEGGVFVSAVVNGEGSVTISDTITAVE